MLRHDNDNDNINDDTDNNNNNNINTNIIMVVINSITINTSIDNIDSISNIMIMNNKIEELSLGVVSLRLRRGRRTS